MEAASLVVLCIQSAKALVHRRMWRNGGNDITVQGDGSGCISVERYLGGTEDLLSVEANSWMRLLYKTS